MSVRSKLLLIIAFVALVPLLISAVTSLLIHEKAFDAKLVALRLKVAEDAATRVRTRIDAATQAVSALVAGGIDWPRLSDQEREGALWLVYRQLEDIAVVALLDERGRGIGPGVYRAEDDAAAEPTTASHVAVSAATLAALAQQIPFAATRAGNVAVGKPVPMGNEAPLVPLAFPVAGAGDALWVVAVGLSLRRTCAELAARSASDTTIHLIDGAGARICGAQPAGDPARLVAAAATGGESGATLHYLGVDDEILAAIFSAGRGWSVVAEQPAALALAPSRRIRRQAVFWIALGVAGALGAGLFLAREISRPLLRLANGAREVGGGNLAYRLGEGGDDEFGQVARTFDAMCAEVQGWHAELNNRVEARTRELKEAQDALLESRKIAAMASLGAGVAHELNNPLTSVLGLTQVMLRRARKDGDEKQIRVMESVEQGCLRMRDIVQRMHSLSQNYAGEGFTTLRIADVVGAALDEKRALLEEVGIEVVQDLPADLPRVLGNRRQLQEVLAQLVDNAARAMRNRPRRTLTIAARSLDDELVRITCSDTGKGIPKNFVDKVFEPFATTKDEWSGKGLGLSVAYRIVEAHRGKIKVAQTGDDGTAMVVSLPVARQGAHLV